MNKAMLLKQYMMSYIRKSEPALQPTSALVYTLSDDGSYYIVGTGFTSLSSIESDTSGGNAGSGLDSTWSGGDLVIPSRYNGKPVKAIAPRSFVDINNITNIYVQDGITHIGHRAFQIANVTDTTTEYAEIPNSVTYFGGTSGRVFWHRSFKSVKIGSGVKSISNYVFYNCRNLTSIEFPNVTSIGEYAFGFCYLKSASFPNATSICSFAFIENRDLQNLEIPNVETINSKAFNYCTEISSIRLPKVKTIESYAFEHMDHCHLFDFREATAVPTLKGTYAFYYTPNEKKIVVPDALYDTWITSTNWSSNEFYIVSSIIKASEYEASL